MEEQLTAAGSAAERQVFDVLWYLRCFREGLNYSYTDHNGSWRYMWQGLRGEIVGGGGSSGRGKGRSRKESHRKRKKGRRGWR